MSSGINAFQIVSLLLPLGVSLWILALQLRSDKDMESLRSRMTMYSENMVSIQNEERGAIVRFIQAFHVYQHHLMQDRVYREAGIVQTPTREDLIHIDRLHDDMQLLFATMDFYVKEDTIIRLAEEMISSLAPVRMQLGYYHSHCMEAGLEKFDVMNMAPELMKVHRSFYETRYSVVVPMLRAKEKFHILCRDYVARIESMDGNTRARELRYPETKE